MKNIPFEKYQTPDFEVLNVTIEKGFASSTTGPITSPDWENGEEDWF